MGVENFNNEEQNENPGHELDDYIDNFTFKGFLNKYEAYAINDELEKNESLASKETLEELRVIAEKGLFFELIDTIDKRLKNMNEDEEGGSEGEEGDSEGEKRGSKGNEEIPQDQQNIPGETIVTPQNKTERGSPILKEKSGTKEEYGSLRGFMEAVEARDSKSTNIPQAYDTPAAASTNSPQTSEAPSDGTSYEAKNDTRSLEEIMDNVHKEFTDYNNEYNQGMQEMSTMNIPLEVSQDTKVRDMISFVNNAGREYWQLEYSLKDNNNSPEEKKAAALKVLNNIKEARQKMKGARQLLENVTRELKENPQISQTTPTDVDNSSSKADTTKTPADADNSSSKADTTKTPTDASDNKPLIVELTSNVTDFLKDKIGEMIPKAPQEKDSPKEKAGESADTPKEKAGAINPELKEGEKYIYWTERVWKEIKKEYDRIWAKNDMLISPAYTKYHELPSDAQNEILEKRKAIRPVHIIFDGLYEKINDSSISMDEKKQEIYNFIKAVEGAEKAIKESKKIEEDTLNPPEDSTEDINAPSEQNESDKKLKQIIQNIVQKRKQLKDEGDELFFRNMNRYMMIPGNTLNDLKSKSDNANRIYKEYYSLYKDFKNNSKSTEEKIKLAEEYKAKLETIEKNLNEAKETLSRIFG